MKSIATILALLLVATTPAQTADHGSTQLQFAGATTPVSFVPTRDPTVQDLGTIAGHEQVSVTWLMRIGSSGEPDSRRYIFSMMARKDGSGLQSIVLNVERADSLATYQSPCVVSPRGCDYPALGIALDAKAKTVRFTDARLVLTAPEDSVPANVVVSGTLKY